MKIQLAEKIDRIKPSATFAVGAKAAQLKAAGEDIIDLSLGEPDFDTPEHIKAAAIKAIHEGFTKYTPVDGIPTLKAAIVEKFARENELQYSSNQILVSAGAKQCLFNLFIALLNPGDEVIIPAPYWVSYPEMVLLADGQPVIINSDMHQNFKINASQLAAAITSKTRLLILNSPSNPSGMAYSLDELAELSDVLIHHPNIMIVTDDIYEHIFWGKEKFVNIVNAAPKLYDRTVVVNGASKAYAMTGWRIGYAAGPEAIINAMKKVQSQSTSNPNSIAQIATLAALSGDQTPLHKMVQAFKERHDYLLGALNQLPDFKCIAADGAFYALVHAQSAINKFKMANDIEFSDYLLTKAKVAVVPGSAFGVPGYIRLSYATNMENLKIAIQRISAIIK